MHRFNIQCLVVALLFALSGGAAHGQNPVQWSGNVSQAVDRARELQLPLLFWVTGGRDADDDLSDAQSECFRDPVVVGIVHKRFVPVRVSRNSRVLAEAEKLGLPTTHGLYCAVLTTDGRLLAQMGPGEVADPVAFASQLTAAFNKYGEELYQKDLRAVLENLTSPKADARRAAQTVYRLGIQSADQGIIGLLGRKDLQPNEVSRLYSLLAFLGTQSCISTLLERAQEKPAADALQKAQPGAIEWLLPALPAAEGAVSERSHAAYRAVSRVCRLSSPKAPDWWEKANPEDRRKELDRVNARAHSVLDYWRQTEGASR